MRWAVAAAGFLVLAGCPGSGPTEPPASPGPFAAVEREILVPKCAGEGCHSGPEPAGGLDLSAGRAYESLVGIPSVRRPERKRVVPGAPERSYLMERLTPGGDTPKMPPGAAPLSAGEVARIRNWIAGGAGR